MLPAAFDYRAPTTLAEALGVLKDKGDDAKVMAGGQSLIPLLKLRFAQPSLVLDIGRLPALNNIATHYGHVTTAPLPPPPPSAHYPTLPKPSHPHTPPL